MIRVYFRFNGPEQELEFVKWTESSLIVRYPKDSLSAGKPWRMARSKVEKWVRSGVLQIVEPTAC